MRKIYYIILTTVIFLSLSVPLKAQVQLSVNFNIGSQPVWGPVGYDEAQYYYLPDIEAYYYVPQHVFYFNDGGRWTKYSSMPTRYRNYDLYRSYKVVINEREPWRNHKSFREKYKSYKGRQDQKVIRDSHDSKYFVNKNHPNHNKWVNEQKHKKNETKSIKNHGNEKSNNKGNNKSGNGKGKK